MRRGWKRAVAALLVVAGGVSAIHAHLETKLAPDGRVAEGILVGGEATSGGEDPVQVARTRAARLLDRRIEVVHEGRVLAAGTFAELGGTVDEQVVSARLAAIGHSGSIWQRLDEAREARAGRVAVALPLRMAAEVLAEQLAPVKAEIDRKPIAARWDFASDSARPHADGANVDLHATVEAVLAAARAGHPTASLVVTRIEPRATASVVAGIDRAVVISRYETHYAFAGNQAGRAQNIAQAASAIDGLALMPGEAVSFNELVGPRSEENGFAQAGEIYKGELRLGIGGGTCQVASTLHAAAYFGALEVVERSPHSRPSGYIGVGLDATVAYPHVDLRLRNGFDFPVLVRALAAEGILRVEILGREQPAKVGLSTATVAVKPYKRSVREAHWLEEGKVVRKQGGQRGLTVEKVRTMEFGDGSVKVETTRDVYPPTTEIYYVPTGTDTSTALPPLPDGVAEG